MALQLFRHFDFQLVNPQNPMQSTSYLLWVDLGLEVRVTESDIMKEAVQWVYVGLTEKVSLIRRR